MKIDSTRSFFDTATQQGERVQNSSASKAFSATLGDAIASQGKTLPSQRPLPLVPSPSLTASPSQRSKPQQSFNERALGLREYRQELLASNIANADTPGYKAIDIDINEALRAGQTKENVQLQYRVPIQGSVDGNTVDMDIERAQFAQNGLMYEYTIDRIKGYYKMMDDLLRNTPY